MSRRLIKIKNFRNIVSKEDEQILYLNNSLDKDKIGELIILIGENNVGKSNILDAINKIKPIEKVSDINLSADISEFTEYEDFMPEIKLVYDTKSKEYIFKEAIDIQKLKMEFEEKLNCYSEYAKLHENVYNGLKHVKNRYTDIIKDEKNINNNIVELKRLYNKMETIINSHLVNSHNNKNNDKLKKLEFDWNKLLYSNNDETDDVKEFEYKIYFDKQSNSVKYSTNISIGKGLKSTSKIVLDKDKIIEEFKSKYNDDYIEVMKKPYYTHYYSELNKLHQKLISVLNDIDINELTAINEIKSLYSSLENLLMSFKIEYDISHYQELDKLEFIDLETIAYKAITVEEEKETYNDIIKQQYGIDFIPQIVFYKEKSIKNEDLKVDTNKFSESEFFKSLLKSINKEAYIDKISSNNYKNKRIDYENNINRELNKIVSKKFNELYFNNTQTQEYKFEIRLENNLIQLFLQKNGSIINLNNQSVGFKWFFNFFFNFLYANELKHGDIVLMDEPGIHLSMPGKRDLRKFIKKFARENGITFICTTHNPSFIDIDYLEELRIIKHKKIDIGSEIQNDFSAIEGNEVDVLNDIINGFGILHRDIITNPDNKVIFVEGITDYNYLTAFKKLYENQKNCLLDLVFLPIGGLGGDDNEMKHKLFLLTKFRDAAILVDSDDRANKFNLLSKSEEIRHKLHTMQLKEIDDSFKEIEDLFSQKDIDRYRYMINKKSGCQSALFKNTILVNELEKETIDNFYKIFKNIKY